MAVWFSTNLSDAVSDSRWAAEFHRPGFKFTPKVKDDWKKIWRVTEFCQYGLSLQMNESGKGFPIYRLNEIEDCFLTDTPSKFAPITPKVANDYILEDGDVLFCRTNGNINYVGRTGLYCGEGGSVFASYLVRVRSKKIDLRPEFLTVYLNTNFGRRQIVRRAMPSNQVNVSAAELKKIDILLPPLDVQDEVSAIVRNAYSAKKQGLAAYTQAQQLLESELGLDKLRFDKPVGYTARFSVVGLSDSVSANRIDAQCFSPEAVFYEDWLLKHANCDRLSLLLSSTAKGRQQVETETGTTDYCSIKHITGHEIVGASKAYPAAGTPNARKDDLLLAITGATIGKIGIVNRYDNLVFSGDMLRLRANGSVNPHYLLLTLDHHLGQVQFNRWITGSTNGHLAPRDVGRVLVPRLAPEQEEQIAALVAESLEKRQESERLLDQAKSRVEQLIEEAVRA